VCFAIAGVVEMIEILILLLPFPFPEHVISLFGDYPQVINSPADQ